MCEATNDESYEEKRKNRKNRKSGDFWGLMRRLVFMGLDDWE